MIPYVREFDFKYGRCDQVSPLVRRVIANNPGPFTFTGTGTYIVGRGEVAVIDPGPLDEIHLDALLTALEGETVKHILVTHNHMDHSALASTLAVATDAPVYAARPPAPDDEPGVIVEEGDDGLFRPDVEIGDGDRFEGPGWTLEVLATPGHTSSHVCFALPQESALFCGDHVMGWSTTVISPPDGDMTAYYSSLDRVAARGYATLWPTHGPPITDPTPFLAAYRAHRLEREKQILAELAKGPATIADMVPVIYAAVDRRLWPAASHSMLAHLIHLVRSRVVIADGEPTSGSIFRLN